MELTTARLVLTPLDPAGDAVDLHAAFSDPEVMRWWNTPLRNDIADTRADLEESVGQSGAHLWAVREDDTAAGFVGLLGGTEVPGLAWILRRRSWGRGLIAEAAAVVVEHAFTALNLPRVEAWVESTNVRSLATAHRVGLTARGRLAQRYEHRRDVHESIILGRSREPEPSTALDVEVTLHVRDVPAQLAILHSVLGARAAYELGEPVTMARVVLSPWSVGPSLRLAAAEAPIAPVSASIDVGTEFDSTYGRAVAAGADIAVPPVEQPWGVREFVLRLADGHQLVVTGPA